MSLQSQLQFVLMAFVLPSITLGQESSPPLQRAHAHNDYYHKRPLLDALDQGFCSVEADVFLRKGKLMVAHTFLEIRPGRTLKDLYLDPLADRIQKKGFVQSKKNKFVLLVDFKSDAGKSLDELNKLLQPMKDCLTRFENGKIVNGQLTIVISGSRPVTEIVRSKNRLVFLDGRLGDPKEWGKEISPLVSESWNSHFKYRGFGEMNPGDKEKLAKIVNQVHAQKKRIRFWALPDRIKGWETAFDAGVDLINTDKLEELKHFLQQKND